MVHVPARHHADARRRGVRSWFSDLALPSTDRGALTQAVIVLLATATVVTMVRRERSLVLLTVGIAAVLLGLMGLRTLH